MIVSSKKKLFKQIKPPKTPVESINKQQVISKISLDEF